MLPQSGVQTLYIAPGASLENARGELLNNRLRDETRNRSTCGPADPLTFAPIDRYRVG